MYLLLSLIYFTIIDSVAINTQKKHSFFSFAEIIIAFFILLMPSIFWQKFQVIKFLLIDLNIRLKIQSRSFFANKMLGIGLVLFLIFKAFNASLERQNERYQLIQNQTIKSINSALTSRTYSPFRQYWFMFAPSPPVNSGYIAFEYVDGKNMPLNINIYGNNMPNKSFAYYHPFHVCSIIQFNRLLFKFKRISPTSSIHPALGTP